MITKYLNYESRFNSVYSRYNLPKRKDGMYVLNLDEKQSKGIYRVALLIDTNTGVYCVKNIFQNVLNKTI